MVSPSDSSRHRSVEGPRDDSRTIVPSAQTDRTFEHQGLLAQHDVFQDKRIVKFLNIIAQDQAANYLEGLRFHERYDSRSHTIGGRLLNFLDWRGQKPPELLKTSYVWGGKVEAAFKESFKDVQYGELKKLAPRVLDDLYKTGMVEPVYVTSGNAGLVSASYLGIRIVNQQLFDAVK